MLCFLNCALLLQESYAKVENDGTILIGLHISPIRAISYELTDRKRKIMRTNPNFREGSLLNDESHPSNKYHVLSDFFNNVLALRQTNFIT